jgi:hypothetical protein
MLECWQRCTWEIWGVCCREAWGLIMLSDCDGVLAVSNFRSGAIVPPLESMFKSWQTSTSVLSTLTLTILPPPASGPTSMSMDPLAMSKLHFLPLFWIASSGHEMDPHPITEAYFITWVSEMSVLLWTEHPGSNMQFSMNPLLRIPILTLEILASGPSRSTPTITRFPKLQFRTCSLRVDDISHDFIVDPSPFPATRYMTRTSAPLEIWHPHCSTSVTCSLSERGRMTNVEVDRDSV